MRVVEPSQFSKVPQKSPKTKRSKKSLILLVVLLLSFSLTGFFVVNRKRHVIPPTPQQTSAVMAAETINTIPAIERPLKNFQGEEFKVLFRSVSYPNTQEIDFPPSITGNEAADERIRQIAEARGYKLSKVPVSPIVKIPQQNTDEELLLQPLAAESWLRLKAESIRAGKKLRIISAYRPMDYQKDLFVSRLLSKGVTLNQIASGTGDTTVEETLHITAIPGYSRHHTGYTVDFWCDDNSSRFVSSTCYQWLSADNYKNAKLFGWIPSYPDGADDQGPEPEPWEYVWVGDVAVRENQ